MSRSVDEAQTPQIYTVDGVSIAHLSFTYSLNGFRLPAGKEYLVDLIDPDLIEERQEVQTMDHSDGLGNSGCLGIDRSQNIGIVFAGQRGDEFDAREVGFVEDVGIGDVAVEDTNSVERLCQLSCSVRVAFDQLDS